MPFPTVFHSIKVGIGLILDYIDVDNTTYTSPIFMLLAGLSANIVLGFFLNMFTKIASKSCAQHKPIK